MKDERTTVYELVGGGDVFMRLAAEFYRRVDNDSVLRPMFPQDLDGPIERLGLFLIQYFGGPTTYSERRGHPRLRMRHLPFRIGQAEKDAWLGHMLVAVDSLALEEPAQTAMREYFERSAEFMINAVESSSG